jgi:hypothetical protein
LDTDDGIENLHNKVSGTTAFNSPVLCLANFLWEIQGLRYFSKNVKLKKIVYLVTTLVTCSKSQFRDLIHIKDASTFSLEGAGKVNNG